MDMQATRFAWATIKIEIDTQQAYLDQCVLAHVDGALLPSEAAAVKYACTELQWRTIDRCLQLHGGYGYMEESPVARLWRDARVQRIYGGSSELLLDIAGRSLARSSII